MIGVFDSGVGGLSVLRALIAQAPGAPVLYLGDQAHVPYGPRTIGSVRRLTTRCVRWMADQGCDPIVIACNTASGAALDHLRATFPSVRFVGTEPAVKPAALRTRSGVIGVLATRTTFASHRYASLIARFTSGARVIEQPCPRWVTLVEAARDDAALDGPEIDRQIRPLLDAGADALVLGCTHFPFLRAGIERAIARWRQDHGADHAVELIDPAPAIARQTLRVLGVSPNGSDGTKPVAHSTAERRFFTTGDTGIFQQQASFLLRADIPARRACCKPNRRLP
jgi:glutamate racemase